MKKALIIYKDKSVCEEIKNILESEQIDTVFTIYSDLDYEILRNDEYDIILVGWDIDEKTTGLEVLVSIKRVNIDIPIIVISPFPDIAYAARALEFGAFDYIEITFLQDRLPEAINTAIKKEKAEDTLIKRICTEFIAESSKSLQVVNEIAKYADKPEYDVLISGETGTGKEVCSTLIHNLGKRLKEPFVAVNCASISSNLEESELFGHEKGAFTGAGEQHRGFFEQAAKGTLFLDEVEELSLDLQAKLLRVVETRKFRRVGGEKDLTFNGRIVYASNKYLPSEIESGNFRLDLYHRISTHQIILPPLRERPEDILPLVKHFLKIHSNNNLVKISTPVAVFLKEYMFPGNVRELEGIIMHSLLNCDGETIYIRHLPLNKMVNIEKDVENNILYSEDLFILQHKEAVEKLENDYNHEYLPWVLKACGNNLTKAAAKANLDTKTFRRKWEKCGLGKLSTR